MVQIGYTMMTEQAGPLELVEHAVGAEEAGFDFSVISDHYFPWLASQGHSANAWAVLGAAARATSRIPLMTYVTCPTTRYHPAVVAQQAATVQLLSQGRFRLGLGSGENLNEHVVGGGWPSPVVRLEKLEEAVGIIRALLEGRTVNHDGRHFSVSHARLWDLPDPAPPIGVAIGGKASGRLAGRLADLAIATEPRKDLLDVFDANGGAGKPRVGQLPVCYDPDRDAAIDRAHDQFRWFGLGWRVNAELPDDRSFAAASASVTKDQVAAGIPCGANVDDFVAAVRPYAEAGFGEIALVQIGGAHQEPFLKWAKNELLPALRSL
ncbi:TIGR03557 family F420-dependent LLM class oxidoreductase [Streptomyces caatingaensis]|uniref:5,10-methylene tetrahydromethanopterin reductase n=1 Tax=Streptomyces caatingaensis TaxID=1678637 RepID=A0A0K9XLU3_9ACTN|nr:TIGR03557 family F420-dependent LLM class oxidoreductase [Streptomyces caatingaensis]KNB54295.1 5,10-methylene tetrahydromethanopterin reductase [Streptomyces caatingaensis]